MKNLLLFIFSIACFASEGQPLKALIIDGQNNHWMWPKTTVMMKQYLEEAGLFQVDIERTAYTWNGEVFLKRFPVYNWAGHQPMDDPKPDPNFHPDFSKYDLVISNFGWMASPWPEETQQALDEYVGDGGGLVIVHAANNSFPEWKEYNKMIGVGGWGGRNEEHGPYVYYNNDGELIKDMTEGRGGSHGPEHEFVVTIRDGEHPITKGMPEQWLHTKDELYDRLRGPAENIHVLATAFSSLDQGGTGRHEPVLMTIDYGSGRVFHTPLGHADYSMECVGFMTSFVRGAEWAATGEVTTSIPDDFPRVEKTSRRLFFPKSTVEEKIVASRELRDLMSSDPHRPSYHFVAPEGKAYPFDPNGAIYWNGKYHLGFIYQSLRRGEREHFWGHAVSSDLLHWTLYPDMLDVKEGDAEIGIFSGGAFLSREGIPHIMYHGWGSNSNLVAYSKDPDLRVWKKFEGNPVSKTPKEGDPMYGEYVAWDPEGWYDPDTDYYYQISGGDVAGFFRSKDMYEWEYLGDLIDQNDRKRLDFEDLSCPDFFSIGGKHMLLFISHNLGTQYYLGEFTGGRYHVEKHARMNWPGGTFFAPEQMVDDQGRNLIWGWVLERKPDHLKDYGWSGVMSLPRVVSLANDGHVLINPPKEFEKLRYDGVAEHRVELPANSEKRLAIRGKAMEIKLEIAPESLSSAALKVFSSPDGREETVIRYDPTSEEIVIDFARSAISGKGETKVRPNCMRPPELQGFLQDLSEQRSPLVLKSGESLKLDVFIDKAIIEVFANGRQCVTQVVYPELESSEEIVLTSGDAPVMVKKLEAWKMRSTNPY